MTTPLRLGTVVIGLLVSGVPAAHLASPERVAPQVPVAPDAPSASGAAVALGPRLPMGPVQGPVSSPFGPRLHPVSGRVRHHDGVDLAVPAGTAVWTVAPGVVRAIGRRQGYGLVVEIDHPTGLGSADGGGPVRTRYAHLASVDPALRPGARVGRGVALGASGGVPGRDGVSTGAHLHFEVHDTQGRPLDPARFVRLPEASSTGPRWTGPAPRASGSGRPRPPDLELLAPAAAHPEANGPEAAPHLPPLVLPDYPSLPTIAGTP